jgi:hypothetical protein
MVLRPVAAILVAVLSVAPAWAADAGKPTGLPPTPSYRSDLKDMSRPIRPPLQPMATDFTPPAPPSARTTVDVCQNSEVPNCLPTVEAALREYRADGLHVRVHCGTYPGEGSSVELRDLRIEGIPCADGRLPRIEMQGHNARDWIDFTGFAEGLWIEKLHLAGPGTRKNAIRLDARGPYVIRGMLIENQENGVFSSSRAEGDMWVVGSRFEMNGHGSSGRQHHIYFGCTTPSCRGFVIGNRFGGTYSKKRRACSNQLRSRARETYVVDSVFDSRAGCVSRSISTDKSSERLVVRDSVFIQGETENSVMTMTPMGGVEDGEMVVENVVVASLRRGRNGFIMNHVATPIRLRNVLYYHVGPCPAPDACVVAQPHKFPGQVEATDVRVTTDRDALPAAVRELL